MEHKREATFTHNDKEYYRVPIEATLHLRKSSSPEVEEQIKAVASHFAEIDDKSPDLLNVQFILDTEGGNLNWDYMPREGLVRNYATAKYKPMDSEHFIVEDESMLSMDKDKMKKAGNTIFGVMTGAALCWNDGKLLSTQEVSSLDLSDDPNRTDSEKLCVMGYASLWHMIFPKTVAELTESIASGNMKVSMERWISNYDFSEWTGSSYTYHNKDSAKSSDVEHRWMSRANSNGKPIYRRSLDFIYGGVASTRNPANPLSTYQAKPNPKFAVSNKKDKILCDLMHEHNELHNNFSILTSDEQKENAIFRHLQVTQAIAALTGYENGKP